MNGRFAGALLLASAGMFVGVVRVEGGSPWTSLVPFSRVDADPNKSYAVTEEQGPWMILAATFSGDTAEQKSQQLVVELRKQFRLEAFTFVRHIDSTQAEVGLGLNKYGKPKMMRPINAVKYDEVAVLVGNYPSFEDSRAQKTLQTLKHAWPKCLDYRPADGKKASTTSQSLGALRELHRQINPKLKDLGPMRAAMICRNPLIPDEYFHQGGLDKLVLKMNQGVEFSLLDCPAQFSVRVATFRGKDTMILKEIDTLNKKDQVTDDLAKAAEKAHVLTTALRQLGYEAYEFHDRHESIVTVGSFDSVGDPRPDGKTEINPAVNEILNKFKAKPVKNLPNIAGAIRPEKLKGISFDVQPTPIAVPHQSIGADYARNQ